MVFNLNSISILAIYSNNVVEYDTLSIRLEIALEMHIDCYVVFGDFELVIKKINDQYAVKKTNMIFYHQRIKNIIAKL